MSPKIQERLDATRRRWNEEVAAAQDWLASAVETETAVGAAVMEADPSTDEYDALVHAHFRAIDLRVAARARLDRIADESELDRRLRESQKLAERFES